MKDTAPISCETITVEVAYALPARQSIIRLNIGPGATAEQAIINSGILQQFQDIDLSQNKIGIFGKLCQLHTVLQHKDRVEIYRPLLANAKEVRRKRAEAERVKSATQLTRKASNHA